MKYLMFSLALLIGVATSLSAQNNDPNDTPDVLETTDVPLFPAEVEIPGPLSDLEKQLVAAAYSGDLAMVKVLADKGANVNVADQKKRTPLMFAASNGHTGTVDFLISRGAQVDAEDSDGKTALLYAAKRSFNETIGHLIDKGANVNVRSRKKGVTALMLAAVWDNAELVQTLLQQGADPQTTDRFGRTARMLAQKKGYTDIVKLLPE